VAGNPNSKIVRRSGQAARKNAPTPSTNLRPWPPPRPPRWPPLSPEEQLRREMADEAQAALRSWIERGRDIEERVGMNSDEEARNGLLPHGFRGRRRQAMQQLALRQIAAMIALKWHENPSRFPGEGPPRLSRKEAAETLASRSCARCGDLYLPGSGKRKGRWKDCRFCDRCATIGNRERNERRAREWRSECLIVAAWKACEARDRAGLTPENWKEHLAAEISARTGERVTAKWVTTNRWKVAGAIWPPRTEKKITD
jgi:hypothetical protein